MLSIKSELGLQVVVHRLKIYFFMQFNSINWRLQNAFVWKWDFKSTFSQEWIFLQSVRHFEIGIHLMIQKTIVSMWSSMCSDLQVQSERNTFQWFIVLRLEGKYLVYDMVW